MKFAFFDAKNYDKPSFDRFGKEAGIEFKYFETKLNEDTAELAHGFDGVCVFVNDTVNAKVIDILCSLGVRTVALRCAGFNNVSRAKHSDLVARFAACANRSVFFYNAIMVYDSVFNLCALFNGNVAKDNAILNESAFLYFNTV